MIHITDIFTAPNIAKNYDFVISILDLNTPLTNPFLQEQASNHLILFTPDSFGETVKEKNQILRALKGLKRWVKDQGITAEHKILIHCHAGVSRSPAVAWVLMQQLGMTPAQASEHLFQVRPEAWPNECYCKLGLEVFGLPPASLSRAQAHHLLRSGKGCLE